ncbi:MAG: methyltransferase [Bacteroidia bacterium]
MPNQTFVFKQFSIHQDKCAMKVGTDAVLLGSWVNAENVQHILDIGTGTGIIALMLAQKTIASIDAIDIDENACLQATENKDACNWKNRVQIHCISLQDFSKKSTKKYDVIVSNPPYFIDSSKALGIERTTARHTDLLSFEELIDGVISLLQKNGKFCIILPFKEGETFIEMANEKKLFLTKLMRVKTTQGKVAKRIMMQFEFARNTFSESSIIIEKEERHSYTDDYIALTKEYYLGF